MLKLMGKKILSPPCFDSTFCFSETYSEAVKILKGEYVVKALTEHNMDRALIFCRTKLDCDNLEKYLQMRGQGQCYTSYIIIRIIKGPLMEYTIMYTRQKRNHIQ